MSISFEEVPLDQIVMYLVFFGLPIVLTVWFFVSLILFLTSKKGTTKRENMKVTMIVSGIVAGLIDLTIILLSVLLLTTSVG